MLSEAKHLCAHRERPFPFAALRASAHCAQGDNTLPMLVVKTHHQGATTSLNSGKEDDAMQVLYARFCGLDVHPDAFRAT